MFKVIQDHRGRYQWKALCDFLLVINSNWHPVSYCFGVISQLIVKISDILRFEPPFGGLRDNVRCSSWARWKARSGLPNSVN